MNEERWAHFEQVARDLFRSGDLDPLYPFLRQLLPIVGYGSHDKGLWFVQLYAAYYRIDSAWSVWRFIPQREDLNDLTIAHTVQPVAVERRNLRMRSRLLDHLFALKEANLAWWEERGARLWQPADWWTIFGAAQMLSQNGPWAAFKWCDLAKYVLGWNLSPTPSTIASGAGPAKGLSLLEADLEAFGARVASSSLRYVPWDQLETALCKWHGIATDRYWLGHDLDELQKQVHLFAELAEAFRATTFPLEIPTAPREAIP